MLSVNLMPYSQRLIQGASGIGASICFKVNSFCIASSSMFGIILGGLMKGMENEGLVNKWGLLEFPSLILMFSNLLQSLDFIGNGSKFIGVFSFRKELYSFGSNCSNFYRSFRLFSFYPNYSKTRPLKR